MQDSPGTAQDQGMKGQHIRRFIQRINDLQAANAREMTMTLHEARQLHADITNLLLDRQETARADTVNSIEMKGTPF